jgi:hypothetical protein
MQTFTGTLSTEFRIVVPEQFLAALRADAIAEGATERMKQLHAQHPVNDDAFVAAILKAGLRNCVRENIAELYVNSGLGGSVSPVKIEITEVPDVEFDSAPARPEVIVKGENPDVVITDDVSAALNGHAS